MIKTAGANVAPAEVEKAIAKVTGGAVAHVVGVPDADRGEIVAAVLAMEDAAQRSSWVEHDGMALPATWIEPYELLAQLGDNSPALIGLLEQYGT